MLSQKEAVYNFVTSVFTFVDGVFQGTKEQRATVINMLVAGFQNGEIGLDNQAIMSDEAKLRSYASGLLSNWLKKDKRLNGGIQYVPKTTGTRTSDPQLREMKKLLSTLAAGTQDYLLVEAAIAARQDEIAAAKAPVIDFSVLPASLQSKFGN